MPFGDYKDFKECVADNQDKRNPEAYCALIHYEITGTWPNIKKYNKKGEKEMPEKNRSSEGSYEQRMERLRAHFDKENSDTYIIYTFQDAVILKDYKKGKYYEIEYSILDDKITSGTPKEVEVSYIQKRLIDEDIATSTTKDQEKTRALTTYLYYKAEGEFPAEKKKRDEGSPELSGPIIKKVKKQRIVYAAVLVPGEPDLDADKGEKILTAEEIEGVAHKWMEEYGNIDYMHGLNNVAKPVETFILPIEWEVEAYGEKMLLPVGTWILAAKVVNDKAWKEVEDGKLTGFSIMGIQNNVLKRIMNEVSKGERVDKELSSALKTVLIKDLGKGWIVPFVSLIDEPCVPKAKFFAIKQKDKTLPKPDPKLINKIDKEGGVLEKIINYFKGDDISQAKDTAAKLARDVEKAGRSISNDTFTKLKNALNALQILIEKADRERKPDDKKNKKAKGDELDMEREDVIKLIDESLDEKLKPIHEGLKSLLPKEKDDKKEDTEKGKKEDDKEKDAVEKEGDKKVEKEEGKKEEKDEEKEALKTENLSLKQTLEKLQEAKKALSKSEKGQEDEEDKKEYTTKDHLEGLGRDSQGRAVTKKKEKE